MLKYKYCKMWCVQSGQPRPNPNLKGLRPNQATYKQGCPAYLVFSASSAGKLVVRVLANNHNHPCNSVTYCGYPAVRALTDEGRQEAIKLQKLKVVPSNIRPVLKTTENRPAGCEKLVLGKDICNVKTKYRKDLLQGRTPEQDPGSSCVVDYDEATKKLNFILIQTSEMRETFHKFPEVFITDITYKVDKEQLPASVMQVMDGEGWGRVVSYGFICNERKETLTNLFGTFVETTGREAVLQTQTIVCDKDLNQIEALESAIPQASVHLCAKHVDANFQKLVAGEANKDVCLAALRGMLHSATEEDFDEHHKDLKEMASKEAYNTFDKNWLCCKQSWSLKDRLLSLTLDNITTNRCESHNDKIKLALDADTPLYEAIHNIVNIVFGNKVDDLRYRDHLALTKKRYRHFNEDPLIEAALNDLTSFAAKFVCDEMVMSEAESRNPNLYITSVYSCTCKLFKSLQIPCRHIMRKRRVEELPIYEKNMMARRWHKDYNIQSTVESSDGVVISSGITYVPRVPQGAMRRLQSRDKFKRVSEITRELHTIACDCGTREFYQRLQLLEDLKVAWQSGSKLALAHISTNQNQKDGVEIPCGSTLIEMDGNADGNDGRDLSNPEIEINIGINDNCAPDKGVSLQGNGEKCNADLETIEINGNCISGKDSRPQRCDAEDVNSVVRYGSSHGSQPLTQLEESLCDQKPELLHLNVMDGPLTIDLTGSDEAVTNCGEKSDGECRSSSWDVPMSSSTPVKELEARFIIPVVKPKGVHKDKFKTVHTQRKKAAPNHLKHDKCAICKKKADRNTCDVCKKIVHTSKCSVLQNIGKLATLRICLNCKGIREWPCHACKFPAERKTVKTGKRRGLHYYACQRGSACKGFLFWEPKIATVEELKKVAEKKAARTCSDSFQVLQTSFHNVDSDDEMLSDAVSSMEASFGVDKESFCLCEDCGSVKNDNHVCVCHCCNDILIVKNKCSTCLKYVCSYSCCVKIPNSNDYQCNDCQAEDPICDVCGKAGGSELCTCLVCNKQIHSGKCSVPGAAENGISTGGRVCRNCYCSECRLVKDQDHICICKCCGSRPFDKKQCGRCRYFICDISCCKIIPSSSEVICSDCDAAAVQLPPQMVKDIVNMQLLSDEHMAKVAAILRRQLGHQVEGLSSPLPVEWGQAISPESINFYPRATQTKPYIQIINTGRNHWVACLIKKGSSVIHILDSNRAAPLSGLTKIQAAMLMKTDDSCILIERPYCMQQTNSIDCGLFAIANAVEFALNSTIHYNDFNSTVMRDHLYNCLINKTFTEFPKLSSRKKKLKGDDDTLIVKVFCVCRLPDMFCDMCKCDVCGKYYHFSCVGVTSNVAKRKSWKCPSCL